MSKSLGNFVGVQDLIYKVTTSRTSCVYFLCRFVAQVTIRDVLKQYDGEVSPRVTLATLIVRHR